MKARMGESGGARESRTRSMRSGPGERERERTKRNGVSPSIFKATCAKALGRFITCAAIHHLRGKTVPSIPSSGSRTSEALTYGGDSESAGETSAEETSSGRTRVRS